MTFEETVLAVILGIYLLGVVMFIIGTVSMLIIDYFTHHKLSNNYFSDVTFPTIALAVLQGLLWPIVVPVWICARINGDL